MVKNNLNKKLLITILILLSLKGYSQKDSITFIFKTNEYILFTKSKIKEISKNESVSKYIFFPTFSFKIANKSYKCGEQIEYHIDFKNKYSWQYIQLIENDKPYEVLNHGGVFDLSKIDSLSMIEEHSYILYYTPDIKEDRVFRSIYKYQNKNPDVFIFTLSSIQGFWMVKNGKLFNLKRGLIRNIRKTNGNKEILKYGQDYINDISNGGMILGKRYKSCNKIFNKFKKVYIKVIKE